ncbi:aminoglycoside phosphotransferase family protein [Leifsonia poae]|uniref:aminoglycoside phosphotransferase family protein n=1 Tax=Leifsonia poae TaxID=110933 RepID=UPI003D68C018
MTVPEDALAAVRERLGLRSDSAAFATSSSVLQPVRRGDDRAFLKLATSGEERAGNAVLRWWDGDGAARVLAVDGDAVLLERADDDGLAALARSGPDGDDEATRVLCRVGRRLHAAGRDPRPGELFDLRRWFRDLLTYDGADPDGMLAAAAQTAEDVLSHPTADVVLHGDLHHGNVLHFGERGWLAIDPKPLHGDPGFDVANILCNPDAAVALAPGRLERRVAIIAAETGMPERRALSWALAWGALSSLWSAQDGGDGSIARAIAVRARALLAL